MLIFEFWSQLLLGGPIIMASNVQQQQQQCIRQRLHNHQHHQQVQQRQQQNQQQHPRQQDEHRLRQTSKHSWQRQEQQLQQHQQHQQQLLQRRNLLVNQQQQQQQQPHCCFKTLTAAISPASSKLLHFGIVAILLQLLVLLGVSDVAHGEGNVGCQFVRTLCLEGSEVCYDDNIFGKCIPTTGVDVEDIEKTPLSEEQSRLLATMLEELQGIGLGWDHPYVQCRIQGSLFSLQRQTLLPPNLCANLAPERSEFDPAGAMAFVRFTPPEEDYADELYYPPLKKASHGDSINTILHELQLQDRQLRHDPMELAHFGKMDAHGPQVDAPNVMDAFLENERDRIQREQEAREAELEAERKHALRNQLELYQMLAASEPDPQPYQRNAQHGVAETLEQVIEREPASPPVYVPDELVNESNEMYFPGYYGAFKRTGGNARKHTEAAAVSTAGEPLQVSSFFRELAANEQQQRQQQQRQQQQRQQQQRQHQQQHNLVADAASEPNPREYYNNAQLAQPLEAVLMPTYKRTRTTTTTTDSDAENERKQMAFEDSLIRNSLTPFEEEAMLASNSYPHNSQKQQRKPVFTEGGLVYVPEYEDEEEVKKEKARELLANMLGFTRHERLDVKKPGPLIGPPPNELHELNKSKSMATNHIETSKEVLPAHIKGSKQESSKKKKVIKDHSDEDHAPHSVDTEYAHVFVKNPIDSWSDGVRLVNELANILHMQGYFTYLTVQTHEVSFRVDSNNPEHKTASDIARFINENRGVRNNILRRLGITVLNAGVGDKIKSDLNSGVSSSRIELAEQGPDVTHIMVYMFAGAGAAAVIVIFVTLILIKRHDKKRDKLGGLQTGIAGAESCSKDYQELCRARMAGKGNAAEPVASGRITSLSKENDRPPSSRSSTSSWSEEPALTNMDISTGHMVLSYMEDHLRNKGRLQREWEALCRYEAEPSAREAAQQPQCANLNRTGAPQPYDHSRVVLNHLANAEGLDYINASTITDHDPRTPAYVAAQGPLPTTLAHFWQMIWEQGAVVIVALCRLQENGEIACARYWPEEGAEVYHIYEVHLVSEHIWCDDYLVRSFYLKNLRTSETRTVTQFHFLSWPQGGVPAQAKALLDFRRKVNKSYRGRSCPIVVHGSSGAGRTGAYILLDLVLGRMNKGAREIDIAATLEHLRDQRASLVATRQQFEFVLMAVAEEVHAILKALPANQSNEKRDADAAKETGAVTVKVEEEATSASGEQEVGPEEAAASTSKASTASTTATTESEKVTVKETTKEKEGKSSTPAKTGAASSSAKKK